MDDIIKKYQSIPFDELNYCIDEGIMYQRDMNISVSYDKHYFEHYVRLEKTDIANKLNEGRTAITQKYCNSVLDIGVGSGEFIKASKIMAYGYDINPVAIRWLRNAEIYRDPYAQMPNVDGLTFWDTMEHIPSPSNLLSLVPSRVYVFISMPIFADLTRIKKSKHYKPGEHLTYWSSKGLMKYMSDLNFDVIEMSDFETRAGREDILSFVFVKQ